MLYKHVNSVDCNIATGLLLSVDGSGSGAVGVGTVIGTIVVVIVRTIGLLSLSGLPSSSPVPLALLFVLLFLYLTVGRANGEIVEFQQSVQTANSQLLAFQARTRSVQYSALSASISASNSQRLSPQHRTSQHQLLLLVPSCALPSAVVLVVPFCLLVPI